MKDIIRELGLLVNLSYREKIDAFVEENRAEIISSAWGMSEVLCKWRTLCAVWERAQPCNKYGRVTVLPTPESEIRVFHRANGLKIMAEFDRLKSLDPDTVSGLYEALDIVVRDVINNKEQEEA